MNDSHPAGTMSPNDASYGYYDGDPLFGQAVGPVGAHPAHEAPQGYAALYDTGGYDTTGLGTTAFDTGAHSFTGGYAQQADTTATGYAQDYAAGYQYAAPASPFDTSTGEIPAHGAHGYGAGYGTGYDDGYDTGGYPTVTHDSGAHPVFVPGQAQPQEQGPGTGEYEAVPAEQSASSHGDGASGYASAEYAPSDYESGYDTGEYGTDGYGTGEYGTGEYDAGDYGTGEYGTVGSAPSDDDTRAFEPAGPADPADRADDDDPAVVIAPSASAPSGPAPARNRRRKAAKRSALLTVAVPSVAVMGVAAVAAATITSGPEADAKDTSTQAADEIAKKPVQETELDRQLEGLSVGADDFAERASRTQKRIDLKERQAEERRRAAEEAARKEAMRPKFALPVAQRGLSAGYGQAGVNWMSLHTGIDFPVSTGTPVMAATDGTVSTQWDSAYGNMVIVTAADGTETWYCHLSSARIRSGTVKAGDVIGYAGSTGNSTGPHLHFEVHPGGGPAINPSAWLQSKGLNPN
ncbi:peptidoglycan DD-metalloendopeptidase family protein [Streptomyces sp. SCUT-3]|uniref:M23 family metallopeptidase n=1 Tax=Streptomyces TaxID=1883 RepID=UPI0015F7CE32|nr:M23 family metallopeptidase [Streptomyces sp. SCUT-3]QMV22101.1 peptidoglycan DD-metalloendopeptidase family protein [Streptomyces sp. SCUT-3]